MLIPSDRHSRADLICWRELERADHAAADRLSSKIERSLDEIDRFAHRGSFYASFSGGKDSAVMIALLAQAKQLAGTPVAWFRATPTYNPDAQVAVMSLAERLGFSPLVIDYDSPPRGGLTAQEREAIGRQNFDRACRIANDRFGRRMLGMRADESGARKLRFRTHGLTAGDCCCPLGWWRAEDIYAFAASREIPICSVYGMLGGGRWTRNQLRVDSLGGSCGDQFGRAEWEREYYGDVLRRLELQAGR